MQKKFLGKLPDNVQQLVHEIESYSHKEIEVLPNPYPVSPTDPNPNGPAMVLDESRACILIRNENIGPQAFTHELLHIHRYWVQCVPQILPNNSQLVSIKNTSQIEGALEHLAIVPEEAKYGFEPYEHWNKTAKAIWSRVDLNAVDSQSIRPNFLLLWLTIQNLVTDTEVKQIATKAIEAVGLRNLAKKFNYAITKHMASKEQQLSAVVHFLRIPRNAVKIVYFDVKNGRRELACPKYK